MSQLSIFDVKEENSRVIMPVKTFGLEDEVVDLIKHKILHND